MKGLLARQRWIWLLAGFLVLFLGCGGDVRESSEDSISTDGTAARVDTEEPSTEERALAFRTMDENLPTRTVPRATEASVLRRSPEPLSISYTYEGNTYDIEDFPERTDTTGLLILHGGVVLFEGYYLGADESSRFLSMSVAKSFTSTLLGIARGEGLIASFDDPVSDYLPELEGTGYEGVAIKHLLQMSSGVDFVEEYENEESDIARLGAAAFGGKERVNDVAVTYGRSREPGTEFYYASVNTQILCMLLEKVTGRNLSSYMAEKLWQPLGAEHDAYWILDQEDGVEAAFGGLNVSLRDYGRLGLLMAYDGVWQGRRILPEGWVAEATLPDAPHVQPGKLMEGYKMGYQYQWWTFPGEDGSFTGEGIYGQLLMVNPVLDLVVVKTSAWPEPWVGAKEEESWALFEAVSDWVREEPVRHVDELN